MSTIVTDKKGRPIAVTISIVLAVCTLGYMLPWMVASMRGKSNHVAVMVVNLLLGWTLIGWVIALVMACTSHQVAGIVQHQPQYLPQPTPPQPLLQAQPQTHEQS